MLCDRRRADHLHARGSRCPRCPPADCKLTGRATTSTTASTVHSGGHTLHTTRLITNCNHMHTAIHHTCMFAHMRGTGHSHRRAREHPAVPLKRPQKTRTRLCVYTATSTTASMQANRVCAGYPFVGGVALVQRRPQELGLHHDITKCTCTRAPGYGTWSNR